MALHDDIQKLREASIAAGKKPVPYSLQGVSKARIENVLKVIDRVSTDQVDAIYALLDDQHSSWYTKASKAYKFCAGASTAQIACHVGILQRGGTKLDREGRDYWLKPMWELTAIEKVYFDSDNMQFIEGHPVAKSSNCAYRLADDFKAILQALETEWQVLLEEWVRKDKVRQRVALQAEAAKASRYQVNTKHSDLIQASF